MKKSLSKHTGRKSSRAKTARHSVASKEMKEFKETGLPPPGRARGKGVSSQTAY